jgi:hypothetical protein
LSLSDPNSKPSDKSESDMTKVTEESKRIIADSNIVTYQHVELISKWINRLETTDKLTTSYEFKLFFRASRDGYSRNKFINFAIINLAL